MISPPTKSEIEKAAGILRRGGLVAIPTETVYGLAADAHNEQAVRRIFEAKRRPFSDPLIVHVGSLEQISKVADLGSNKLASARFEKLATLWPAPLTLLLPKAASLPALVTSNLPNVALRIPAHSAALELLKVSGLALAAPSANPFSYVSPTTAKHVEEMLGDRVEMIIDGGPCEVGVESTILSLVEKKPLLLRPGAISIETLSSLLNEEVELKAHSAGLTVQAPGMLERHYAPRTKTVLIDTFEAQPGKLKAGMISFNPRDLSRYNFHTIKVLSSTGNLEEVAHKLYAALRELDSLGLDLIVLDRCTEQGIGAAIMNRVKKAAA